MDDCEEQKKKSQKGFLLPFHIHITEALKSTPRPVLCTASYSGVFLIGTDSSLKELLQHEDSEGQGKALCALRAPLWLLMLKFNQRKWFVELLLEVL